LVTRPSTNQQALAQNVGVELFAPEIASSVAQRGLAVKRFPWQYNAPGAA